MSTSRYEQVMDDMAERSTRAYRDLVYGDADFADYFHATTPVREIQRLQLGSRPSRRKQVDAHRGLPRDPVGVLADADARGAAGLVRPRHCAGRPAKHGAALLREMERDWPFFAAFSNAEMARRRPTSTSPGATPSCTARGRRASASGARTPTSSSSPARLRGVRDEEHPLDREPVLQRALARRNPSIDPPPFVQLEPLRRPRAPGGDPDDPALVRASLLAINGIAGGLRNTG